MEVIPINSLVLQAGLKYYHIFFFFAVGHLLEGGICLYYPRERILTTVECVNFFFCFRFFTLENGSIKQGSYAS